MSARRYAISGGAVLAFLALWEAISHSGAVSPVLLSAPSRIVDHATHAASWATIAGDAGFTLRVFGTGLLIALGVGGGLGALTATSPLADQLTAPFLAVLNALPKIILMPLIVLWAGIGMGANVFLAALMGSFPILLSTRAGVRSLDPALLRLGRVFGASPVRILGDIVLPAVAPHVLAGLRVAVSYVMVGALIAEFFAGSRGVGYRMVLLMSNFHVDAFFLYLLLVAGFTLGCTALLGVLERRVEGWRPPLLERPGL